tara:strand:+ start:79 stop:498 length:420 start_codon:yes stop_codon:yes gene_type:complete
MKIKVKKIKPEALLPEVMHKGDAALDLYSLENINLKKQEIKVISTGISLSIPKGYWGNIRDRSGLAFKHGLHTLAGVVDSNYRGEIKVVIINLREEYNIKKGDRIAQLLIQKTEKIELEEVEDLDDTKRGKSGFGNSGY